MVQSCSLLKWLCTAPVIYLHVIIHIIIIIIVLLLLIIIVIVIKYNWPEESITTVIVITVIVTVTMTILLLLWWRWWYIHLYRTYLLCWNSPQPDCPVYLNLSFNLRQGIDLCLYFWLQWRVQIDGCRTHLTRWCWGAVSLWSGLWSGPSSVSDRGTTAYTQHGTLGHLHGLSLSCQTQSLLINKIEEVKVLNFIKSYCLVQVRLHRILI